MQGKGIVKFFLVLLTLVTLVQFLYMIPTNNVENRASAHADRVAETATEDNRYAVRKAAETAYLDSMSSEVVLKVPLLKDYTYEELKAMQLALGLDLKGGMNVVLEVSVADVIQALAGNSQDPVFVQAMQLAHEKQKQSSKDFVTLFGESFEETDPNARLASIFLYEFKDKGITTNSANVQPSESLKRQVVAGPYHPSFGELVLSRDWFRAIRKKLEMSMKSS